MNRHLRVKFGHIKYKKSRARGSEPHIPPPPPQKKAVGAELELELFGGALTSPKVASASPLGSLLLGTVQIEGN